MNRSPNLSVRVKYRQPVRFRGKITILKVMFPYKNHTSSKNVFSQPKNMNPNKNCRIIAALTARKQAHLTKFHKPTSIHNRQSDKFFSWQ